MRSLKLRRPTFLFIVNLGLVLAASNVDAEIIKNLEFYEDYEMIEGEEDNIETYQDDNMDLLINEERSTLDGEDE